MDLDTARGMIDAADWKMRDSFCARMEGSAAVAAAKSASGDAVYQPGREDQILADRMQGIPAEFRDAYRGFLSGVMRISREYQYRKRLQADLAWRADDGLGRILQDGQVVVLDPFAGEVVLHTEDETFVRQIQRLYGHEPFITGGLGQRFLGLFQNLRPDALQLCIIHIEKSFLLCGGAC